MKSRETICILQVPPFDPINPIGGAEAIAADLAISLSSIYEVFVLYGHNEIISGECHIYKFNDHLFSMKAFTLTDEICYEGEIDPVLSIEALTLLRKCKALLSFERVLKNRLAKLVIANLGGIGYPHCKQVAESKSWDYLVVPSQFVYQWITSLNCSKIEQVRIIRNGINFKKFAHTYPGKQDIALKQLTMLLPCRPDWEKGFREGINLAKALKDDGFSVILKCLKQNYFLDIGSFYEDIEHLASDAGVQLIINPWVSRDNIRDLYANTDLTLCLGKIPEGFGLTVIESIMSGTPVLARQHGAVADILPPEHGLIYIEELRLLNVESNKFQTILEQCRVDCYERGIPYIKNKYSFQGMLKAYINVINNTSDKQ
ncbi:MAG: glycosyltransferase family 4 protein [Cuspidothrix sp.]